MNNNITSANFGLYRVAAIVPKVKVANIDYNTAQIIGETIESSKNGARLIVFPELSLTGYTCADLLDNTLLLKEVEKAIQQLCDIEEFSDLVLVVGAPIARNGHLFNCAVVINDKQVKAVIPKSYIPNYKEFYEKRWMTSAMVVANSFTEIEIAGQKVPFGTDIIVKHGQAHIAVDVCEDLWAPIPPSSIAAINGANIIANLSASNEIVGKHKFLDNLIRHQSSQAICAYVYTSAGFGESTTDLVYAGKGIIAENGSTITETERFAIDSKCALADIDLDLIEHERRVNSSFSDSSLLHHADFRLIEDLKYGNCRIAYDTERILHPIHPLPFVPQDDTVRDSRCNEIINIQTFGLAKRLTHTGIKNVVIGISGGLDSTLALMVAARTFDLLNLDRKGIYGITMPGFGTSGRTHDNALKLMQALGISCKEISIASAVIQHFKDIEHDPTIHDVTYENSQARERTQILMDFANKSNALVIGTGDLSESALGWATYNGDHMSMYNVNASIPKTLARHLIKWLADESGNRIVTDTLLDVLDTPISPELTPTDDKGQIAQKTEELVGPYELNDFFLFYMLRYGFEPKKIYRLARQAFALQFDNETIRHWLTTFNRRFFNQQFKRSCMPDGPKVGSISLSPRGDWRMPSDADAAMWLEQCKNLD